MIKDILTIFDLSKLPTLKIGTAWTEIEIIGEPDVRMTFRGYAPVLPVKVTKNRLGYVLFISAKSLSDYMEALRIKNNNSFIGLKIRIKKETDDKFSKYVVEQS